MKRQLKTLSAACFLVLGGFLPSYAQNRYEGTVAKAFNATILMALVDINKETVTEANPAAHSSFSILFPNATEPKWTQKDTYSYVSFLNNGRKATASFSPKGVLNYVITECSLEQLPKLFNRKIRKSYAGYWLLQATEIQAYGQKAYQAILENASGFITLKYTTDGVECIRNVIK
ncbi:hypothetical protein [Niabella soli]|uniref:Beta-lactamase-inhibitor-like PepSY-like domain-containing protein n=1 Tax=Niabella soli DSM 19437 TaxID=929713 RepID=W0F755_9BACT|nr:hypothetical protein [Niabella soli]AHF17284.1 hypothetical protein NIASO_05160 [Niabella soli DSM 19437]